MKLRDLLQKLKKIKLSKRQIFWSSILLVIIIALIILYFIGKDLGWFSILESQESLQEYVSSFGAWAPVVFFIIQFLQVILAPIPGAVTTIVGGLLFDFFEGFLLSFSAVFLGSICAFLLGKLFGRPLVEKIAGKEIVDKYLMSVSLRQRVMLFLMFLLPFFPDDIICMIAGFSAMKLKTFVLITLFSRPWGIAIFSFFGSTVLSLPFWLMIIIAILAVFIVVVAMKYAPAIEERLRNLLENRFKKKKS